MRKTSPQVRLAHLVGQRFGRWTVVAIGGRKHVEAQSIRNCRTDIVTFHKAFAYWPGYVKVRCECGFISSRRLASLKRGESKGGCPSCIDKARQTEKEARFKMLASHAP